jgi:hypothetical protein
MMSLPACRQRALNRIEQTLVAEDPGLGSRFALFNRLTLDKEMPGTEQVPGRLQRLLRAAVMPPPMMISLLALLAASWLTPSGQARRHARTRSCAWHRDARPQRAASTARRSA